MNFSSIKNRIIENPDMHVLTVGDLAKKFGYSRTYFSRKFKLETGITPYRFLTRLKIKRARERIKEEPDISGYRLARLLGLKNEKGLYQFLNHHLNLSFQKFREEVIKDRAQISE
jgi:AraC-like DNA-binding protein